ncbi:MAG: redoxin domain-containing protein [bacterium]
MKRFLGLALGLLALPALALAAYPPVGSVAPNFVLSSQSGKTVQLYDLRGKLVVLEWTNPGCPFVHKHYDSGNMQRLQRKYTDDGVVWLTIDSSAEGSQGCMDAKEARTFIKKRKAAMTDLLLDPKGKAGREYGAKNTPTMFVINKTGHIVYEGAIDDKPSTDLADIPGARNYVAEALDAVRDGRPVRVTATRAYGCSIKYN